MTFAQGQFYSKYHIMLSGEFCCRCIIKCHHIFITFVVDENLKFCIIKIRFYCTMEGDWIHFHIFPTTFTKGNNFCHFLFESLDDETFLKLEFLFNKEKNLLFKETNPFVRKPPLRWEANSTQKELSPLEVFLFAFIA